MTDLKPERITEAWAKGLKERLADAKPSLENAEPGPYDEQIDLACFYARKAQAYKDIIVEMGKDLKDYLEGHEADATTHEFVGAMESIKAISNRYEEMSNTIWDSFEKDAIRANKEDKPFYDLLGAIYKGMVEEYRACVETICKAGESTERKDAAASRWIYLDDYFKGTGAEPILHSEIRNPDFLERYIKSFIWRHQKR